MGLDYHGVRLMAFIKTLNPRINSIGMLGRQSLLADATEIGNVFQEFEIPYTISDLQQIVNNNNGYCELLLQHLGFKKIESFDFSAFENPTHIHDFNKTIPPDFERRYDLVVDGGSLEHIFNFPIALRNLMRMVAPNGIFAAITPCNNHCGHGFYQFSPELYFSLMRSINGYKLIDIFCHEISDDKNWYRVVDPLVVNNRVHVITRKPTMMLVIARRVEQGELPELQIQQSDYEKLWAGQSLDGCCIKNQQRKLKSRLRELVVKSIPSYWRTQIRNLSEPERFPQEFFTRADSCKDSLLKTANLIRQES